MNTEIHVLGHARTDRRATGQLQLPGVPQGRVDARWVSLSLYISNRWCLRRYVSDSVTWANSWILQKWELWNQSADCLQCPFCQAIEEYIPPFKSRTPVHARVRPFSRVISTLSGTLLNAGRSMRCWRGDRGRLLRNISSKLANFLPDSSLNLTLKNIKECEFL